ncbi:MAG: CDP-alcohol phosphatidyltransferase family protein [Chloroflexota bacterium]
MLRSVDNPLAVFDAKLRGAIAPPLARAGHRLASAGVTPDAVTAAAWGIGIGACVAAAFRLWPVALVLWLGNRALDGLDGPVARSIGPTDRGGFLDVVADFSVYGGFVVGVAIAVPDARLACGVLLFTFYVSGTALLTLSSLLERRRQNDGDERSVRLTGGLAEGFETIVVFVLFCILPGSAAVIAWVFAAAVAITAAQRVMNGVRLLRADNILSGRGTE